MKLQNITTLTCYGIILVFSASVQAMDNNNENNPPYLPSDIVEKEIPEKSTLEVLQTMSQTSPEMRKKMLEARAERDGVAVFKFPRMRSGETDQDKQNREKETRKTLGEIIEFLERTKDGVKLKLRGTITQEIMKAIEPYLANIVYLDLSFDSLVGPSNEREIVTFFTSHPEKLQTLKLDQFHILKPGICGALGKLKNLKVLDLRDSYHVSLSCIKNLGSIEEMILPTGFIRNLGDIIDVCKNKNNLKKLHLIHRPGYYPGQPSKYQIIDEDLINLKSLKDKNVQVILENYELPSDLTDEQKDEVKDIILFK